VLVKAAYGVGKSKPEARQVLQSLAGGAPGARLTQEAKALLQRLAKQVITKP
jgi:hypothetical protein